MTQTHIIEWTAGAGQAMSMSLEQQGATAGTALLPVSGVSRLRWGLSEFGFGGLNQEITVNIVDTTSDTFFGLLSNVRRQDIRIVIKSDGDTLFIGYPDYQQIASFPYKEGRREISVKFYNPIGLKVALSRRQADNIFSFNQSTEGGNPIPGMVRVHQILRSLMSEYGGNILYSHRWRQQEGIESTANNPGVALQYDDTCYLMFNQIWVALDTFGADSGFAEGVNQLARSFWFRYGWSFVHQKPFVCQQDIGRVPDDAGAYPYIVIELQAGVIGQSQTAVNRPDITNAQMGDFDNETFYRFLPALDENKINILRNDPRSLYIDPYSEIRYSDLSGGFLKENPQDDLLSESYSSSSPLNPFSYDELDEQPGDVAVMVDRSFFTSPPDPDIKPQSPFRFSDPYFYTFGSGLDGKKLRQAHLHESAINENPLPANELNAELHMLIRKDVQHKYRFEYMGYLDPMLNYQFNGKIITLYEGEYDLRTGETLINKSMSIFE